MFFIPQNKKSSPKTKQTILGDEIRYCAKRAFSFLEVETESHFQTELRTVFIYIPINGRLDSDRTRQEESITALHAETETGFIATVPVVTVQVYISSQKYTNFVEIVTSAHTQRIDIRSAALPCSAGIQQQSHVID